MEIISNEKQKTIEVWLTSKEKEDEHLQSRLKSLYAQWKQQKYFVAVFCSGSADLYEQTAGLLIHNQKSLAGEEIER